MELGELMHPISSLFRMFGNLASNYFDLSADTFVKMVLRSALSLRDVRSGAAPLIRRSSR